MSTNKIIPIGPYHPLQEEPEFFRLHVDGETVVDIDIEIGYNHRMIEKIAESKSYDQVTFLVERICGICSTSHPFAYTNAIDDLLGVTPPERALYIRTIVGELERIHSHLLWLGLAGHFLGYNTVWMWAWRYREPVLDIFERITGNRNHYAMFKPGGVRRDFYEEDFPWIKKTLKSLIPKFDMFKGAVLDDPIIRARTEGIGILTRQDVHDYSVVGPTARASGVGIDVRKDDPYAAYDKVEWKVITHEGGGVFAKAVVRILELYESTNIILQCLDNMPKGDIDLNIKDMPAGEGIGRHEAPRGEVFHYIMSDGGNSPAWHKVRAPSFMNIASNKKAVIGGTISDATIILAAVDPCYCCTERTAVVDYKTGKKLMDGQDLVRLSQEKTEKLRSKLKS
ncbi:MAG: nickel-dependent hydrogenase large subunit [Candidatus Omnitrophica bacterium]|nr:nickel-dependent hydrogenase large subunit [Candidatus Omnitrophota bacterium]